MSSGLDIQNYEKKISLEHFPISVFPLAQTVLVTD